MRLPELSLMVSVPMPVSTPVPGKRRSVLPPAEFRKMLPSLVTVPAAGLAAVPARVRSRPFWKVSVSSPPMVRESIVRTALSSTLNAPPASMRALKVFVTSLSGSTSALQLSGSFQLIASPPASKSESTIAARVTAGAASVIASTIAHLCARRRTPTVPDTKTG